MRVIRLGTVIDQMLFDKDRIVVKAGKPVEIVFENTDLMPHNFVVTQPGALEEIGLLGRIVGDRSPARSSGTTCPARRRSCWRAGCSSPASRRSSASPRRASRASILMSAPIPATGGGCTARSTSSRTSTTTSPIPRATWPSNPLPIAGRAAQVQPPAQGVEVRRPRLGRRAARAAAARSPTASRCSRWPTASPAIAWAASAARSAPTSPSSTPSSKPVDILKEILDPSAKINEKYQTYVFETESGKVITGPGPRGHARADQGDREPAGQGRARRAQARPRSSSAPSRRTRSCPRACSTS